jgi:hypothetical protein
MLCPFCKGVLNLARSRWPACHAHGHKIIMLTQAGWSHAWSQEPEPTHHRASLAHGEAKQMIAYYTTVEQEHELTLQLLSIIITFHHLSRITLLPFWIWKSTNWMMIPISYRRLDSISAIA